MSSSPSPRVALYPGTFDPPTCGHLDLIVRSRELFDRLIVAVAYNERKSPLFSTEKRLELLRAATHDLGNVECVRLEGLTVDFARKVGARMIIRGLRAVSDFEFELQMAVINREMAPGIETIFLAPATEFIFLSSSVVKELWRHGGDIRPFVPRVVSEAFDQLPSSNKDVSVLASGTQEYPSLLVPPGQDG